MDNPVRGILLIVAATICFSTSDLMAKILSADLPAVEIAWIRYVVFTALAAMLVRQAGTGIVLRNPVQQVVRGLGLVGSAIFFMMSLRSLPMAEAATIGFASPVLITILSVPFLGERVDWRRWVAVGAGILGVIVVVRPGTGMFQMAAIWGLSSSMSWAVATILTRKMSGAQAATMLLWSAMTGLVVLSLLLPFVFVRPTLWQVGFGMLLGVVASSGQYLMVFAYRHAPASLLAPFSYLQLIWAVVSGYLVFDTLPDEWTLGGAGIIALSGLAAARSRAPTSNPASAPARVTASRAA